MQILIGFLLIAQAVMAQSHHIEAMHAVGHIHVAIPHKEIRQRHSEIVGLHVIEKMFLAIGHQAVEAAPRLIFMSQGTLAHGSIEQFVGRSVIVVEGCCRFGRCHCAPLPAFLCLLMITKSQIGFTQKIQKIIVESAVKLALAQMMGIFEAFS